MNSEAASFNMTDAYSFAEWFTVYSVPLDVFVPRW